MKKTNEQTQRVDQMIQKPFADNNNAEATARLEKQIDAFRTDLKSHAYVSKLERKKERATKAPHYIPFSMKLAMSTASVLVIAALLLLSVFSPGAAFAFEDVVEQFMKFRPYRCHIATYRDGVRIGIRDVYYRDNYQRRDESTNVISGRKVISVYDRSSEPWKLLHIVPDDEFATEAQIEGVAPAKDPDSNLLYIIQQLRENPVEDLGWDNIGGIEAKGFSGTIDGIIWNVWADPETGLPVAVEKITNESGMVMEISRFEFDISFEESLFSTVAPEGYRVQKLTQEKGIDQELPEFVPHSFTQVFELGGEVQSTIRMEYLAPSIRREVNPDGRIDVIDMSENDLRQMTLYPETKVAIVQTTEGFGSRKDPYCLNLLERTRADKHRLDLGEKQVNGRMAYGIKSESPANAFEFWVDKKTDLPLQMIIHHLSSKAPRRIIYTDFDFETPLDATLFSTTAPEGYEVKSSVQDMDDFNLEKPKFVQHSFRQQLELSGEITIDMRVEYLTLSRRRQVYPDGKVEVIDMSETDLKTLTLEPSTKTAVKEVSVGFGIHKDPYCLGIMQQTTAQEGRIDLGEKMIEGRLAYGFKNDTFEVWADKETKLPLMLIIQHHNSPEPRRIIMSEFDFTTPLDPALFSTEPPEGYSVTEESR